VQGVVVIGGGDSHEFTRQLLQAGVHVVEVDHADAHLPSDAVLHDDERAGRLATRRLVELGHVDPVPAVIAGPQSLRVAAERLAGYRTALAEAGLRDDPRSVLTTDFGVVEGAGAMRRLLALPVPPTAVVCGNDELAAGALAVLRERGIAVPGEVSVVGCDDVGPAARLVPGLTTVHLDCEAAGNQAVWQLVQRSRRPERARIVLRLDVRLVERASTGPPRARP
jgi:LacI family transcriptional regulator